MVKTIFISSTSNDLKTHRLAVTETLERLGQHVVRMEVFGARPESALIASLADIEGCDLFIGIYAHRYGFIPAHSASSISEQEFDHAVKHGKPIFCFFVQDDHPWPPTFIEGEPGRSRLIAFKAKIGAALIRDLFTTPEDLAMRVAAAVGRHLAKQDAPTVQEQYWQAIHGEWTGPDNEGIIQGSSRNFDGLYLHKEILSDFTFSATLQAKEREASLAFRMTADGKNGFLVIFVPQGSVGNPGLYLAKRVNGKHTFPKAAAVSIPADPPIVVTIKADGPAIRVSLNGQPMFDFQDHEAPIFAEGRLGFRVFGGPSTKAVAVFSGIYLAY